MKTEWLKAVQYLNPDMTFSNYKHVKIENGLIEYTFSKDHMDLQEIVKKFPSLHVDTKFSKHKARWEVVIGDRPNFDELQEIARRLSIITPQESLSEFSGIYLG